MPFTDDTCPMYMGHSYVSRKYDFSQIHPLYFLSLPFYNVFKTRQASKIMIFMSSVSLARLSGPLGHRFWGAQSYPVRLARALGLARPLGNKLWSGIYPSQANSCEAMFDLQRVCWDQYNKYSETVAHNLLRDVVSRQTF